MQDSAVEIMNRAGAGDVIVARFETNSDTVGQIHIAGGASQRFEAFDRLTVTAPKADGDLRVLNQGNTRLALLHQTKSGHEVTGTIAVQGFRDLVVAPGDQISLTHGPGVQDGFAIPVAPIVHVARFGPAYQQPIYAPNQLPPPWVVQLEWTHPDHGSSKLLGYNIYRARYNGRNRIEIGGLNQAPQLDASCQVEDVIPPFPYNHRYAVTAVGHDGIESPFSNIRIIDHTTQTDLIDAGFMPL